LHAVHLTAYGEKHIPKVPEIYHDRLAVAVLGAKLIGILALDNKRYPPPLILQNLHQPAPAAKKQSG
jgi:hypothetical protein